MKWAHWGSALAIVLSPACSDGVEGLRAPEAVPTSGPGPCPVQTPEPEALVTWSPGSGGRVRVDGPKCLAQMVPMSVTGGTPPYRWRIASAAVPGVSLTEADRASARLWLAPRLEAQFELRVEDAVGASASIGVFPATGRPDAAWVPLQLDGGALALADLCSDRVLVLATQPRRFTARGRWLVYAEADSAGELAVFRVNLQDDFPTPEQAQGAQPGRIEDLRLLWADGSLSVTRVDDQVRTAFTLIGPPGGASWPVDMGDGAQGRTHRVIEGRSRFVACSHAGCAVVSPPEAPAYFSSGDQYISDARWVPEGLLVAREGAVELLDMQGGLLTRVPLSGPPGFAAPDLAWFVDYGSDISPQLVRIGPGCVDRYPMPPLARSPGWFVGGRAGTAGLQDGGGLGWVIRDDGSLAVSLIDVPGDPDRGAVRSAGPRVLFRGERFNRVVTLDASGGSSDAFVVAPEDVDDGSFDLIMSPDGTFVSDLRGGAQVVLLSDDPTQIIASAPGEVQFFLHGLAGVIAGESSGLSFVYDPIRRRSQVRALPGRALRWLQFLQ